MINIIESPVLDVSGYDSYAVSTSQMFFYFRREDYEIASVVAATDTITLDASHGDVTSEFQAGDKMYINDGSNIGLITVLSSSFPSTQTVIIANADLVTDTAATGFVNAISGKENYILNVELRIGPAPVHTTIELFYINNTNGDIKLDISKAVFNGMIGDYDLVSVSYTEVYAGSTETSQTVDTILAVKSVRQILSNRGSNLYDYTIKEVQPALFLTDFDEPKMWEGWDFYLYFINIDFIATLNTVIDHLNINKGAISANPGTIFLNTNNQIFAEQLVDPTEPTAEYIGYQIKDTTAVTEYKYIKFEEPCKNPVMIQWLNSKGGHDTWLFQIEQAYTNQAEEGLKYDTPINENIETVTTTKQRLSAIDTQFILLKADRLSQEQLQGLHKIKNSEDVKLWLSMDGLTYVNVRVNSLYSTDFTSGKSGYQFTLSIELPDNFDFFTGKQY